MSELDKRQNIKRDAEIYALGKEGKTFSEIAKMYNMSATNVKLIIQHCDRYTGQRQSFGEQSEILSNRTLTVLRYANILGKEELLNLSIEDAYRLRGAGDGVVSEIIEWQRANGKDVKPIVLEEVEYVSKSAIMDIIKKAGVYSLVAADLNSLESIVVKKKH